MNSERVLFYNPANGKSSSWNKDFERTGFKCRFATGREEALHMLKSENIKAVVIFVDSCGEDGIKLCRLVKKSLLMRKIAILMLSSCDDEESIVLGFEAGADDYVTNLHGPRELTARVKTMVNRINVSENNKLHIKDIEIDLEEHKVKRNGRPIDLTYIQFKLLYLLASQSDSVFSRREILDKVWGKNVYVTYRTVDVHIKRLREKLGEYKYPSQYIETVHGTGYRLMQ